ncbi:hypothetical protein BDA99DRAFT_530136 [Phascolomyces articulosus]|uniref:F-box domain-containing protein n=1 Tax=Phascolomyces articulosus TaxID=60185 RepID=A0AAD5P6T1_9FUNG|nr:hypothetical protein BDA99DRAFT_530136 [Phascolomyces articulosus]
MNINKEIQQQQQQQPIELNINKMTIDENNKNSHAPHDFISQMPHEIFCEVMNQLSMNTIVECAIVNRIWRATLLDRVTLRKTFILLQHTSKGLFMLLPNVHQHVKRLEIDFNSIG